MKSLSLILSSSNYFEPCVRTIKAALYDCFIFSCKALERVIIADFGGEIPCFNNVPVKVQALTYCIGRPHSRHTYWYNWVTIRLIYISLQTERKAMNKQIKKYLPAFRQQMDKLVILNDEEWTVFESYLTLRTLLKKDHFTRSGEVCKELGFILKGSVRLYHIKDGEEITGYFCLNNEFISSYTSFLKQIPGLPYIQALENTLLITLSFNAMRKLLNHPVTAYKMERFGRLIAENLVFCYEDRMQGFVTQSPEERYATLLHSNPRMLQHIPQHYLANYLGITATSLSRIRKRIFEPGK
jgi:CRP-like cAMP-binding protein